MRYCLAIVVVVLAAGISRGASAPAVRKSESPDSSVAVVEGLLRREIISQVDRRTELEEVLKTNPNSTLARWSAGYVREGKVWRSFDAVAKMTGEDSKLAAYREQRAKAAATAAGQLNLATWCRRQGLPDQERAHLFAALSAAPRQESDSILERLGYVLVGGQWLTCEQLTGWQESNRRALAALKTWGPKLERIAAATTSKNQRRDIRREALKELADPEAIPAIEYTLCGRGQATASVAVDLFNQIRGPEGTVALAKQAVFSKWAGIRDKATAGLKSRRPEDFVPALIQLLARPADYEASAPQFLFLQVRPGLGGTGQFVLVCSFIIARETDDQFQLAHLTTTDYRISESLRGSTFSFNSERLMAERGITTSAKTKMQRSLNDATRDFEKTRHDQQKTIDRFNELTNELNGRIIAVLAAVSGLPVNSSPSAWWNWWGEFTDTERLGEKQIVRVDEVEITGDPTATFLRCSCFSAGTPIQSEVGIVPIESIRAGDRVLSKDAQTGELGYKLVLRTTLRPAKELLKLHIGDETITATGGHRFWVSGEGWVKARDLKPQMLIHTVTGNAPVWSVEKGPTEPTYNLVVDEFHTYFVGQAGLLVQDLPLPRPTDCVVPGLPRRRLAAASPP